MLSWHGKFFLNIQKFWKNLREFSYNNRTFIEILFIFIYAFEQAGLIILTYLFKDTNLLTFIISIFALIVLTTFSLHKLVMESRIKLLEKKLKEADEFNQSSERAFNILKENNKQLQEIITKVITKNLNSIYPNNKIKRKND